MKQFKILVPKAGANDEKGTAVKLYEFDELIEAKENWQEELMNTFVQNGWAMEVKVDAKAEEGEAVRARDDKGHYIADDPSTPDVNEAWEGGKAPMTAKQKRIAAKKALLGRK